MPRENLLTLLADFERYSSDVAIIQRRGYCREYWTYAQLLRHAAQFAIQLKSHNVRTGDRVLLWAPNCAEWLVAFWGCLLRGAVVVPMDDAATPEFADRVATQAAVQLIVSTAQHPPLAAAAPTINLSDKTFTTTTEPDSFAATKNLAASKNIPWHQSLADEPIIRTHLAQILFTSGTTAEPRGVLLTHGNFLANLEPLESGIAPYLTYERWFHPLRFVSLVPLSHVFGQFMTLFVPPLLGATVVFESSNNPRDIIHTIKHERATALIAVPRILDLLRNNLERNAPDSFGDTLARAATKKFLHRAWLFRRIHRTLGWKFWAFICGGAALPSDTEDFFKRLGYAVVQGYGMTETASLISLNHPFRTTQGSIGKVLPGRQFRLAEDGEILVRGENVSSGYWSTVPLDKTSASPSDSPESIIPDDGSKPAVSKDDPESGIPSSDSKSVLPAGTRDPLSNGWLRTGDLGELDPAGNLRFRGRKKNVIVTSAGLNIYPDDLESALRKQPQVSDCVVIPFHRQPKAAVVATGFSPSSSAAIQESAATPTNAGTQQRAAAEASTEPCAVLLVSPAETNATTAATHAITAANATLADFQQIRTWLIWPDPDFPRTSTGKPRQAQIAARATELLDSNLGTPISRSAPSPWSLSSNSALTQLLTRFSATPSANLEQDLNLSSLDRVELLSTLESQFHVELDETAFAQAKTVADLQHLVTQPQAQRSEYSYPRWTQFETIRAIRLFIYYALVWPATLILAHPKITGRQNLVHLQGPALIISNHISSRADIGLILAALPAKLRHRLATAMAGETLQELRKPPRDWFAPKRWLYQLGYWLVITLFNVFPLPRFSGFRESFQFAGESVDRRYSVLVFPEGHVNDTPDGRMDKFQPGIGLLAANLQIPIIPVRLDGVAQMKQARRRLAGLNEITIRIGAPIIFTANTPPEEITRQLESAVEQL